MLFVPYAAVITSYIWHLFLLLVAAVLVRYVAKRRETSNYLFGGAIGSFAGFILANVAVALVFVLLSVLNNALSSPDSPHKTINTSATLVLIFGPLVASGVGILGGAAAGLYFVHRWQTRNVHGVPRTDPAGSIE